MASQLENFARAEREAIREEIKYLRAGGKVFSPSGEDISKMKLEKLDARLEHVNLALQEAEELARSAASGAAD